MAQGQAFGLQGFQRCGGIAYGGLPQGLQFGKGFFTQMTCFAPAVAELVQDAVKSLPIVVQRGAIGFGPCVDFFYQRQALCLVLGRFCTHLVQPGFHDLVGFIAGFVKPLPHGVVGCAALVGLFPLVAQRAQSLLHLASTNGLAFGALEQAFRLGNHCFTQLVCTPALPALQLTGGSQRGVGLIFQLIVDQTTDFLERVAQRIGGTSAGFAMALGDFGFQCGQHLAHACRGLGAHFRVDLGFGLFGRGFDGHAARSAQLVRPHGHGWQRCCSIQRSGHGQGQSALECLPHHQQLAA